MSARGPRRPGPVRQLIIMAKAPVAGRAKTRLAQGIGAVPAACLARTLLATLVARVSDDRRWRTTLAITPDTAVLSPMFPRQSVRAMQGRGTLGARMQRQFDAARPGPVLIVGSDIADLRARDIAMAFRAAGAAAAVLGPSIDGGYWLIGMRRSPRVLRPFADVRWSTPHARADTLRNLPGSVALIAEKRDVDTVDDLPVAHLGRTRTWLGH